MRGGGRGGGGRGHGGASHHRGGGFVRSIGPVFAPYPYFEDPPEYEDVVFVPVPVRIHGDDEEEEEEDVNTRLRKGLVIG